MTTITASVCVCEKAKPTYEENIIFSTRFDQRNEKCDREAYEEFLSLNNTLECEYPFEAWLGNEMDMDVSDFVANLKCSTWNNPSKRCVICGSLGLWTGRHDIYPVVQPNIYTALERVIQNMDDFTITKVDYYLHVRAYHHDGCNEFDIYLLNEKGMNAGDGADLSKKSYHKVMKGTYFE